MFGDSEWSLVAVCWMEYGLGVGLGGLERELKRVGLLLSGLVGEVIV